MEKKKLLGILLGIILAFFLIGFSYIFFTPPLGGAVKCDQDERFLACLQEHFSNFHYNIVTSGNVTADYFFGNGSQLTGIRDTNATTACSGGQILLGNGTCHGLPTGGVSNGTDISVVHANVTGTLTLNETSITDWSQVNASSVYARSATYVVCASNAQDTTNCDYLCNGTDDQYWINTAINSTNGGKIQLSNGLFNISQPIYIARNNITLIGQGIDTTIIIVEDSSNSDGIYMAGDSIVLKDFSLDLNGDQQSSAQSGILMLLIVNYCTIDNIKITEPYDNTNSVMIDSLDNKGFYYGVISNNFLISENNDGGYGFKIDLTYYSDIVNNYVDDFVYGFYSKALYTNIESNYFEHCGRPIYCYQCQYDLISNNRLHCFNANLHDIYMFNSMYNQITSNYDFAGKYGLYLYLSADNIITNHEFGFGSGLDIPVYFEASDRNYLMGNHLLEESFGTGDYALFLDDKSDDNVIVGNAFSSYYGNLTVIDQGLRNSFGLNYGLNNTNIYLNLTIPGNVTAANNTVHIFDNGNITTTGNISADFFCNTTSCWNVTDFLVDTTGSGGNSSEEIWAAINNNTFYLVSNPYNFINSTYNATYDAKPDADTWNTSEDVWAAINNGTFLQNDSHAKLGYLNVSGDANFTSNVGISQNLFSIGDYYLEGGDIRRLTAGPIWIFPQSYFAVQTASGQDVRFDIGDDFIINDQDDSDRLAFEVDSATGNVNITGQLNMEYNVSIDSDVNGIELGEDQDSLIYFNGTCTRIEVGNSYLAVCP